MLDTFFKRLKHPDPAVRVKAAEELGKLEDERALEPLQEVFKTDPNPQVREMAKNAGRRIWKARQERTKPRRPAQSTPDEDALVASITEDALKAGMPEQPSLGDMVKTIAADTLAHGVEGAALGMLAGQLRERQKRNELMEEMELARRMSQALMEGRGDIQTQDETPEEAPAEEPNREEWLRTLGVDPAELEAAKEPDEGPDDPPALPERGPGIRRIKPKQG
jgi:hypothetical protein